MQSRAFSLIIFVIAVVFSTGAFLSVGIAPKQAPKPTVLGVAATTDEAYINPIQNNPRVLGETVEVPVADSTKPVSPAQKPDEVETIGTKQETSENFSNSFFNTNQAYSLNLLMSHVQPELNRCIQIAYNY